MKLAWMGEYRGMVEALIHYCNIYAAAYKVEKMDYEGVHYSYAQIQVLEYLLENEEREENMSAIAARLGITRSNFTKIVNRLVDKGLLEKSPLPGSRKELRVSVNAKGRALYEAYSQDILRWHFSPMFQEFQKIPAEYYPLIRSALYGAMRDSTYLQSLENGATKT
ncbi:MAG: MarR family transcriptional regulator [Ruminococcaceae bacterium]|nr:MarR family transcriptional regulator [Oscillospiraceae bacterium]